MLHIAVHGRSCCTLNNIFFVLMQPGFFEIVVLPLFQHMVAVLPGAKPFLAGVRSNHALWKARNELRASAMNNIVE